jgi:hypothetical protein
MESLEEVRGRDPRVAAVVAGARDHEDRIARIGRHRARRLRRRAAGLAHEALAARRGGARFDLAELLREEHGDGAHGPAPGTSTVSRATGSISG